MKDEDKGIIAGFCPFLLSGLLIGLFIGCNLGKNSERRIAIDANCASWTVDSKTGDIQFTYKVK